MTLLGVGHCWPDNIPQNLKQNHRHKQTSMNADSHAMTALAARIQDRATQFFSEQTMLQTMEGQLEGIRAAEQKEFNTNASIRRNLLETTRSRHDVELDLYDIRETTKLYNRGIHAIEEETAGIHKETETAEIKLENDIESTYAPHQIKIELFNQAIESVRERRQSRRDRGIHRKEKLAERIRLLKQEKRLFLKHTRDLQMQIEVLENEELRLDKTIANLASQVQKALSERTNLRLSLKSFQGETTSGGEDSDDDDEM
eukprot:scaffold2243_cov122-Cylindrotheca_fusiformis.AAC.23